MNYERAFKKVIEAIPILLKEFKEPTKVYIGKTEDPRECAIRHAEDDKLHYLTVLAKGVPSDISKLETDIIKYFKENTNIALCNRTEISTGNPNADQLYVCFDSFLPDDDLGEYSLDFPKKFPVTINE